MWIGHLAEVGVTSRASLPFYLVLHLPVLEYVGNEAIMNDQKIMILTLGRGLSKVIKRA